MENLKRDGFVHLKGYFSGVKLTDFAGVILELYAMQAMKIGEYRDTVKEIMDDPATTFSKISRIIELMEAKDKEALYQVQKFIASSSAKHILFDFEFRKMLAGFLDVKPQLLLMEGPALFINRPASSRLLYKWHSEAHYYPKRRRFLNIWFPLFDKKTAYNGTMRLAIGSHTKDWPFAEYVGYNKDSENKANHFVQYEVPDYMALKHPLYPCTSEVGDLIVFDRNLLHTSMANNSSDYSFAVVARAWTPVDDLTLSGRMEATPYGGDIGRADLVVA